MNNEDNQTSMKNLLSTIVFFFSTTILLAFRFAFDLKASIERGKTIYQTQCMSCHLPEGQGIPNLYPPLTKSDYLGDKNRSVKIVLLGARGTIKVNGSEYKTEMKPSPLTDEQASDVLNYIRNTWGNKGKAIQPSEIQPAVKAKVADYTPY